MAWAIESTGSEYLSFPDMTFSGDFTWILTFKFSTVSGNQFLCGSSSNTSTWVGWFGGNMSCRLAGQTITLPTDPVADVWYEFKVQRIAGSFTFSEPTLGSANGTQAAAIPLNQALRFGTNNSTLFIGQVKNTLSFTDDATPANSVNFDFDASDHSNGGGPAPYPQPIVIDAVGGNNAVGTGWSTTDLGYWINEGGGPTIYPWWLYGETE